MDRPRDSGADQPATTASDAAPLVERRANTADRRSLTVRSILRGAFNPRRRAGRRTTDRDVPIDWHHPQLLFLALTMLALSVADAFLTVTLLGNGATEVNPLLALLVNEHPSLFAVVKMALTGIGIVLLVAVARSRLFRIVPGKAVFLALVAAYAVLVAYEAWLIRANT
ncbi:MAG TPA: DUF5658 family protein [Gammaproteobacteria bacterium]|jgi:hypothetical protein|nr:DUF5658 family protein [Gammaproteobacteria bacterium]